MAKQSSKSSGEKPSFTDTRRVKELVELMREHELVEIELVEDKSKITLRRANPYASQPPTPAPQAFHHAQASPSAPHAVAPAGTPPAARPADETEQLVPIKAELVGTFYSRPAPDADPYISIGAEVGEDTVVCIIEAMKVMNEIKAGVNGTVAKVLVQNGQAVEYNQTLFLVKPS